MSVRSIEALERYLRRLCGEAETCDDAALLERLATGNDRKAFELLIARHGPMVLGTARRLADNSHDAEDVFQAVFLSLARLARTIRQGRALPAWLHRTTCRVAARLRARRPVPAAPPERYEDCDPAAGLLWREVCQILDEELQRLPERLRSPLLLCYLSGLTRDEAARQLGWSLGTLKRRLEEGRQALRLRLAARGIASVGLALTVLTPEALQAAVSQALVDSCLRLAFSKTTVVPGAIAALVLSSTPGMKGLVMKWMLALLVALALGIGIYAGTGQTGVPQKVDGKTPEPKPAPKQELVHVDDPLPAGSTLRFGTSRFRHGIPVGTLAVSPDGKIAFVANDSHMEGSARAFDLATGRVLFTPTNIMGIRAGVFSPDGRSLVTSEYEDLYVRDAATGKVLRKIAGPHTDSGPSKSWGLISFTPDGKAVVTVSQGKFIHLIDFETGKTIRDISMTNPESDLGPDWSSVLDVAISPDGKLLASGGYDNDKGNYFARLWDVETGKELRRFPHGKQGYGVRCLAFSPDGKTLATLGTQSGVILRVFDVATGKEVKAFPKDGEQRTARGSVAFSPDGKTLAAAGASIRLFDTTTWELRLRIDRQASDLHFTDGGKTLTAAVSGAIHRWDTATGALLTPEAADSVVEQILVTPDGSRVITRGQDGEAHIWDGATGKHLRRFQAGWNRSLALSPDGRFLAWPVDDATVTFTVPQEPKVTYYGSRIRLYDIALGQLVDRFPAFKGAGQDLAFTQGGKKLVTIDSHPGKVRIWDFETAKEERSFDLRPGARKKDGWLVGRTQLSPDGKTAVVVYVEDSGGIDRFGLAGPPQFVRLWDVATGKLLPELQGGYPLERAFSPDGRLVVTTGQSRDMAVKRLAGDSPFDGPSNGNVVCETATGKRVASLPDELSTKIAAFSGDGRMLATTGPEGVIHLWEVATWKERAAFKGHRDRPTALAFAPGGQLLSGSLDTTVLVWDSRK
jgi:RNA polymerase sigma factor (sigma-70 family)